MRIVIDLQGAQSSSRFRGIGRYSLSLAKAIAQNAGDHEVLLVLNGLFRETIKPIREAFSGILPSENIHIWYAPGPTKECNPGTQNLRESAELIREAFIANLNPDVLHISSMFEGYGDNAITSIGRVDYNYPISISFYDLIPFLNPKEYLEPNKNYANYYLRKLNDLKKANCLLAISEFSRQEGADHLGFEEDSIVNISSAVDPFFQDHSPQTNIAALNQKLGISKPFILYTGGADPRKNLKRLLQAYAKLDPSLRNQHQLVLAGRIDSSEMPELTKAIGKNGLSIEDIIFADYITDDELQTLYYTCKLFILPSWHEGFGLPALEAMKSGAAVIGSNATSIPEVIQNPQALFDPLSVDSIANKIQEVLTNPQLLDSLKILGKENAKQFSWDFCAQRAIKAFESIAKPNRISNATDHWPEVLTKKIINLPFIPSEEQMVSLSACLAQNFPAPKKEKQLLIDVSELNKRDAKTGIQRVVRSLLSELLLNPPAGYSVQPIYANNFHLGYRYANRLKARYLGLPEDDVLEEPITTQPGDVFLGLDLQADVVQAQKQYLAAQYLNGLKVYFVVYDLLPIALPWAFPDGTDEVHSKWIQEISKYDGIFCISKAVADTYVEWAKDNIPNLPSNFLVSWFHLGADIANSAPSTGLPENATETLEHISAKTSFVLIGTIEPRKGYAQTLEAFEVLWSQGVDVNLVFIGKQGWLVEELIQKIQSHPELNQRLFWLESISDEYLEKLYHASTCLIAGSFGEGFGLPLIEAASKNIPIIARDIPVFREVAGDHAFYYKADNAFEYAQAVQSWLTLYQNQKHPTSGGMTHLTWKESTDSLVNNLLSSVNAQ
ncbi:glycosyltransferase family 4 protein [Polynucleobacter sp. 15G-AUS-farblos]|uniref:glycosyltransferase family 4 protein n=1 Tax=Polynucleobacter sp. 15G-AUS-farblos TaxID=2689094 RepID=UPI001C0AFBAD|nr:glycosyltransferase family 1 protein [Polynucleobacter sp. 15G-AUS-farblos]MBU3584132.1 glycosyltransferase family 4 protein [Polynucleobacter sp. 15G-AUS-farblos]